MTISRWPTVAIIAGALLVGCQRKAADPLPVFNAPSAQETAAGRDMLTKSLPDALIGRVVSTQTPDALAEIADLNPADFQPGDAITYATPDGTYIGSGNVIRVLPSAIHATTPTNAPTQRPVLPGDLAVKFK